MKRHDIEPRFTNESSRDEDFARLAETTQQALNTVPLVSFLWVRGYVATGTQGEPMSPIPWPGNQISNGRQSSPDAAMVVRVYRTDEPSEPTIFTGTSLGPVWSMNFRMDRGQVILFEPYQMDAGVSYDMLIMFVAGVEG